MILKITKNLLFVVFMLTVSVVFGQQKTVTGTVSDETGPLPGVTVLIQGTTRGTETDFDGNYSISVKEGDVIVFSFIGMETQEKVVGASNNINVSMVQSSELLTEIEVIATGFDNIKKGAFTGSATTVKAADLKIDGIVDVTRMIEGRAAGVNVQNITGTFGAAPRITIRGSSSIFGNNNPLYVIDGVVQEDIVEQNLDQLTSGDASTLISSTIAGINANDIEKIDLLKDASATSLYGARARNGVVVITTKSGRKSTPITVKYNLEQTVREIPNYSQYDILDSKETISVLENLRSQGFLRFPDVGNARFSGVYGILERRINTLLDNGQFDVTNVVEARNRALQEYELANTDWFKTLFNQSVTLNHSLSFTGGGENNAFYASLSFLDDPGWTVADEVNRITANLRNTFYFSDKFNLTLTSVASVRDQRAPGTFQREANVVDGQFSRDFDINPFSYALNTSRALRPRDSNGNLEYYTNNWAPFNILEELENNFIDLNVKDIRLQLDASYKVTDNLTYEFNGSARYVDSRTEHQIQENSNVVRAYNADDTPVIANANIFLYDDPNDPNDIPVPVFPEGGLYIKNTNTLTSFYIRNSLKYNNTFGDNHNLDVLLGQELRYIDRDTDNFTGYGLQFNNGFTPFTDPRLLEKIITEGGNYFGVNRERERTVAFFSKITYDYDNRYTFSVTGRYDGSNRQGRSASSRWLPTGTISGKWNASKEDFLIDSKTINNLQLRASYGLVATPGNATNALAIFRSENTIRPIPTERETFLNIEDLENSELTWEKQYEFNLGVDLGLFNNRVSLSADVYQRDIFDNIDLVRTSGIGGELFKFGNNSDAETRGFEIGINTRNIVTDNFTWSSAVNFSYFEQEITKLENEPRVIDVVGLQGGNVEGFPFNSLFSLEFTGLNSEGLPMFNLPDGQDPTEDVDFQDSDNITDYLVFSGSVLPNMFGGITNNFKYKNWDLSVLVTGSGGNVVRLNPSQDNFYSGTNVFSKDAINRWIRPGDENITNIPKLVDIRDNNLFGNGDLSRAYNAYNFSTERVASGDFLRLKNVSLGYNLDRELVEKLGLSSFRVQLQGTNLFLLYSDSKLNGQDPEFYGTGGVALPITRQYTMSLNIGI
ncbi:SusC/RagA family TonB-linked outer membrane protein [Tenacibaculum agarivorans]|uniref:SusC/RagA family TonB-linked outer membrane protein n=1 Tax=Tenacibaculum agarivorans TaxID=1908389 RepID=UPI000A6BC808|nr:SusC/RagA family TonB-linked outer membrane protein [Tenacibaculum agarivorans]